MLAEEEGEKGEEKMLFGLFVGLPCTCTCERGLLTRLLFALGLLDGLVDILGLLKILLLLVVFVFARVGRGDRVTGGELGEIRGDRGERGFGDRGEDGRGAMEMCGELPV